MSDKSDESDSSSDDSKVSSNSSSATTPKEAKDHNNIDDSVSSMSHLVLADDTVDNTVDPSNLAVPVKGCNKEYEFVRTYVGLVAAIEGGT